MVKISLANLHSPIPLEGKKVLRTVIDSVFPLEDASKAHERASHGHIQGKIVLNVTNDID